MRPQQLQPSEPAQERFRLSDPLHALIGGIGVTLLAFVGTSLVLTLRTRRVAFLSLVLFLVSLLLDIAGFPSGHVLDRWLIGYLIVVLGFVASLFLELPLEQLLPSEPAQERFRLSDPLHALIGGIGVSLLVLVYARLVVTFRTRTGLTKIYLFSLVIFVSLVLFLILLLFDIAGFPSGHVLDRYLVGYLIVNILFVASLFLSAEWIRPLESSSSRK